MVHPYIFSLMVALRGFGNIDWMVIPAPPFVRGSSPAIHGTSR